MLLGLSVTMTGCGVGAASDTDDFWDDTRDDDGSDAQGDALVGQKRVAVVPGETSHAERVDLVPVGRSEGSATRRIVLQLAPNQLPKLAKGDRLITPVEVQATTRCDVGQVAPGCNYNPTVRVELILSGNATDTSGSGASSQTIATLTQSCTHADHHCMFVFTPAHASHDLTGRFALPCVATSSCYVNVVMSAWDPAARSGGADKVLVGGNDGNFLEDGRVEGDVSRLMAIRERGIAGADRAASETSGGGSIAVNTNANPVLIYSHRLKAGDLVANEQFVVEAMLVTEVNDRARVSSELFLTTDPNAAEGPRLDKISPAQIGEQNGVNCTAGTSPCTARKVAVFHIDQAIHGPVYVNLAVKSAVPGGGSTKVTVHRNAGFLRAVRYSAALGD